MTHSFPSRRSSDLKARDCREHKRKRVADRHGQRDFCRTTKACFLVHQSKASQKTNKQTQMHFMCTQSMPRHACTLTSKQVIIRQRSSLVDCKRQKRLKKYHQSKHIPIKTSTATQPHHTPMAHPASLPSEQVLATENHTPPR